VTTQLQLVVVVVVVVVIIIIIIIIVIIIGFKNHKSPRSSVCRFLKTPVAVSFWGANMFRHRAAEEDLCSFGI
jgi:amino acid transporter